MYRARAADVENCPTASADVYMSIGQVGPRTLPKWRMSGTRFVRNRVSIMTAALLVSEPLKGLIDSANPSDFPFGFSSTEAPDGAVLAFVEGVAAGCGKDESDL